LNGEETKYVKVEDRKKWQAQMTMDCFDCHRWLCVTVDENDCHTVKVLFKHHVTHIPYVDISLPDAVTKLVEELRSMPAGNVSTCPVFDVKTTDQMWLIWTWIIIAFPETELNQKQVYVYWALLNRDAWRLHDKQLVSALKVLDKFNDIKIEVILIPAEEGISALAFAFKEVFDTVGSEVQEITMESTCTQTLLQIFSHS
jgi:hypothetical protein